MLIAECESPAYAYGDYFQVFNFDLRSGKKVVLEKGSERGPTLDVADEQRDEVGGAAGSSGQPQFRLDLEEIG